MRKWILSGFAVAMATFVTPLVAGLTTPAPASALTNREPVVMAVPQIP